MLCHGLQDIVLRFIIYHATAHKISPRDSENIVSRFIRYRVPTEPGSFSASEVTVRMGRIRHTLPVLWHFRTMTPAFPTAFMRLIAPRLVPLHAAWHIALNLFFHHNTLPPFS